MKRIKDILCSEQGMAIINMIFMVSFFWSNWGIGILVYLVWLIYLGYSIGHTRKRTSRNLYIVYALTTIPILILSAVVYL